MDNIQAAIDAGKELAIAQEQAKVHHVSDDGTPFLFVNGQAVSVEHLLPAPVRRKVNTQFKDLQSFVDYVNEFKRPQSKIFAEFGERGGSFTAALDFHSVEKPSFVEDKAVYACPTTPEWNAWLEKNGKPISQVEFAHFVEEQRVAFVKPSGATMLEIARTLEGKTECVFKSGANLTNGDRELVYAESTTGTAGRGEKLPIPSKIEILVQPFFHGVAYTVEALLRYRINGGNVVFIYELQKVHDIIDAALLKIKNDITEKTQITPYIGTFK